jgi:outer membrane receptor protein involved in Fe transport
MNRRNLIARRIALVTTLTLVLATAGVLCAQNIVTGDLTGTITDPSDAVVAGANVTLKSLETGATQSTITSSGGVYRFVLLKPGSYKVSILQKGFKSVDETIDVPIGQIVTSNIRLELGSTSQIVEVTGEAPLIDKDNANLTTSFSASQLQSIPVPGQDITSYAYSAPGIVMNTGGSLGGGNFSAYGLPGTSNLFTVNGADQNDPYLNVNNSGASNLLLGANELDQVAIVANGYTGQYGRQAGAQINAATKSGNNSLHGNADYWWNGSILNANDWFSNFNHTPRPFANNNQWAASLGGPIKKDKAFFFVDSEGLRYVLPGVSGNNYLPTAAFANYVLSQVNTTTPGSLAFYQNIFSLYAGSPGASRAVPVTAIQDRAGGCGDFAGSAGFGGGALQPCAMFFTSNQNNLNTEWLLATRLDYNFTSNDRLFGRFKTDHGLQATATDPVNPVFNANSNQPEWEGQINHTHIFSGSMVNQLIIAGMWYSSLFTADNLDKALQTFPTTMQFNDGIFVPLGGQDNTFPQGRIVTQYQLTDDFSKTVGNHDLKFGVNFRRNLVSDYSTGLNTSGTMTINSMTEFVDGASNGLSDFSKAFANVNQVRIQLYNVGFYGQDQWKVSNRLSLTAALRLDRTGNPACGSRCFSRFVGPFSSLRHDPNIPYNQVTESGQSNLSASIESLVVGPRVGVTYSVTPNTVIRAGAGLFSDLFPASIVDRNLLNPPIVTTFDANTGSLSPTVPGNLAAADANSNAAFQSGFRNGATLAQLQVAVPQFTLPAFSTQANQLLNPKFAEYNFQLERSLGSHYSFMATYVGNHGYDLITDNPFVNAFCRANCPFEGIIGTTAPDPRFAQVRELTNRGWSNYNGLTTSFRIRTKSFQAQFNYAWSHALDTCSNDCLRAFSRNVPQVTSLRYQASPNLPGTAYGNADYDVRGNISANYVYNSKADWSNRGLNAVAGGWTVAGAVYFHTGLPWSAVNSRARSNLGNVTGLRNGTPLADFATRPQEFGNCGDPNTPCITTSEFRAGSTQSDFGNYARNSLRAARFFDTDLNLLKNFTLTERLGFAVGATFFNILNHPNFDIPLDNVSGGGFGTIIGTVAPQTTPYGSFVSVPLTGRIVQLNARFSF